MLDHPDIASAIATGYPRRYSHRPTLVCDHCRQPIETDMYLFIGGEYYCWNCVDDHKAYTEDFEYECD